LHIPELKEGIEKVIEADPLAVQKTIGTQFKKLILEPIAQGELSCLRDLPASSSLMGWTNVCMGGIKRIFCIVYSFLWSNLTFFSASSSRASPILALFENLTLLHWHMKAKAGL
jgi:hypothetical protein